MIAITTSNSINVKALPPRFICSTGQSPLISFCINALTGSKNNTNRQNGKCAFAGTVQCERLPNRDVQCQPAINPEGAFTKMSEQGRGRLVPVKRPATDKTRGRGRCVPAPFLDASSTNLHQP